MTISSAVGKLRKSLLFHFVSKLGLNNCYRCGLIIESVDDFTMDHKINWLGEEKAKDLFFDVENIKFSHFACNAGATRIKGKHPSVYSYKNGCRCFECTKLHSEAKNRYRNTRRLKTLNK